MIKRFYLIMLAASFVLATPLLAQSGKKAQRPLAGAPALEARTAESVAAFRQGRTLGPLHEHARFVGKAQRLAGDLGLTVETRAGGLVPSALMDGDVEVIRAPDGTVRWMRGRLGAVPEAGAKQGGFRTLSAEAQAGAARDVLRPYARTLRLADVDSELRLLTTDTDELGYTHVRFEQVYEGVPVWGRDLFVHIDAEGAAYAVNGVYVPTPKGLDLQPRQTPEAALRTTIAALQDENRWAPLSDEDAAWLGLPGPETKRVLYPTEDGTLRLAYEVAVHPNLIEYYSYFVDAHTGEILARVARHCTLRHDPDLGVGAKFSLPRRPAATEAPRRGSFLDATATDLNGVNQPLRVFLEDDGSHFLLSDLRNIGTFTLPNIPRVGGAVTLDADNNDDFSSNLNFINSNDNTWADPVSVSAHVNMATSYDYFLDEHGRKAINDLDESMISVIHITSGGQPLDNAFWTGRIMGYGDGNEVFTPLAGALDVAGHEMTHGVVEHTANLVYQFQPGALNESFADVFGVLIEPNDFLIGEDIMQTGFGVALRNLLNPDSPDLVEFFRQPAHMDQFADLGLDIDNGGVHINSGIPNRAAALIIQSLGTEETGEIYYRALSNYLGRSSQFGDARVALVQAATDLFGDGSNQVQVVNAAFDDVGITIETSGRGNSAGNEVDPAVGQEYLAFLTDDGTVGLLNLEALSFILYDGTAPRANHDPEGGFPISQISTPTSGDFLYYVNEDRKLTAIDLATDAVFVFDDLFVDEEGDFWNVAISPEGDFAALASAYDDDPFIYITDGNDIGEIPLLIETTQEGIVDESIAFPDVISWSPNPDEPRMTFDALRRVEVGEDLLEFWSIYEGDFATEQIFNLLPAQPSELSLGNITYSNTDPDIVSFNFFEEGGVGVIIADLPTRDIVQVDVQGENDVPLRPTFSPDDTRLAFTDTDDNQLWIYELDTEEFRILEFPFRVHHPRWFASNARVANEDADELPTRVTLHAAYPNPFNPQTTLRFSLPHAAPVTLAAYDVLGRRVATILDGLHAPGEHTVSWQADALPSGVYLVRLDAGGATQTRRVVLAK